MSCLLLLCCHVSPVYSILQFDRSRSSLQQPVTSFHEMLGGWTTADEHGGNVSIRNPCTQCCSAEYMQVYRVYPLLFQSALSRSTSNYPLTDLLQISYSKGLFSEETTDPWTSCKVVLPPQEVKWQVTGVLLSYCSILDAQNMQK